MKGYDVIHELYYGNIAPNERGFHQDTIYGSAMEALSIHEEWLNERLSAEEKKRFEELMSCHSTIVDTMAYETTTARYHAHHGHGQRQPRSFVRLITLLQSSRPMR